MNIYYISYHLAWEFIDGLSSHPLIQSHLPQVSSTERDPLDEVGDNIISCSLPAYSDIAAWKISHP